MMSVRLHRISLLLVATCALALTSFAASANCDWYVKTSLEQQQRNLNLKCGFAGAEWSVDKAAQANWCASVGPDVSRSAAQKREAQLEQCAAKAK